MNKHTCNLSILCLSAAVFGPGIGLVLIIGSFGSLLIQDFEVHNNSRKERI
jgi:hypothetical protein